MTTKHISAAPSMTPPTIAPSLLGLGGDMSRVQVENGSVVEAKEEDDNDDVPVADCTGLDLIELDDDDDDDDGDDSIDQSLKIEWEADPPGLIKCMSLYKNQTQG